MRKSFPERSSESGNIFALLFGAVGIVGMLGAATMTIMGGPVKTMSDVNRRTVAETSMMAASRMAMSQEATDCDGDDYIEPIEFKTQDVGQPKPNGGGVIPDNIGAQKQDPWGTEFGYCVWDHGGTVMDAACELQTPPVSPANRLSGVDDDAQPVVAVISAGRDRTFQTHCYNLTQADTKATTDAAGAAGDSNGSINGDERLLVKESGSDDIVILYTYTEAQGMMGGLWTVKDADTAEIASRDIEIVGNQAGGTPGAAARIGYDAGLNLSGVGDFMAIKTDQIHSKTDPWDNGTAGVPADDYDAGLIQFFAPMRAHTLSGVGIDPPTGGGGGGGGGPETDPEVGTLTATKWCAANAGGTAIDCTQDAPSGGGTPSGTAGAVQFSNGTAFASDVANFFWDDATNRLGIGIAAPRSPIDVSSAVRIGRSNTTTEGGEINLDYPENNGTAANSRWNIDVYADGVNSTAAEPDLRIFRSNSAGTSLQPIHITHEGNIGLGTGAPAVKLSVVGDINYTGVITDTSDRRLKENIVALKSESMLDLIAKVEGVTFTMKDEPGKIEFGVIAQDLEKIFPDLVMTADDEMKTKSVNYIGLIAPLIEAVKEQQKEIDTLKAEIEELKTKQKD